jgi:hypothetical protein
MQTIKGPTVNRRNVVVGLCASGVLAGCSSGSAPKAPEPSQAQKAAMNGQALATGEMDRWAGMVGRELNAAGFRLKVQGVRPFASEGPRPEAARDRGFLVVFDVQSGGQMPGDLIYALSSRDVGPLDVFVASAATAEAPATMHAVFN